MDYNAIAERIREKNMREFEKHGGMSMYSYKFEAEPTNVVKKYDYNYTGNIEELENQIKDLDKSHKIALMQFCIEKALDCVCKKERLKNLVDKIKITNAKEFLKMNDEEIAEIKELTRAKNDYELACELEKIILDMNKEVEDE